MEKRMLVINGHPDPRPERFCAALSEAFAAGTRVNGWETRRLSIGNVPPSCSAPRKGDDEFSPSVIDAIDGIRWASRLAIIFPLWFDRPPEILRSLFERLSCKETAVGGYVERLAHIVVTMEMPAFMYRSPSHNDKNPFDKEPLLSLPGVCPVDPILIGSIDTITGEQRRNWLRDVRLYGERSAERFSAAPSRTRQISLTLDRAVARWWPSH
jgi:putative NADPH-quinone reductase